MPYASEVVAHYEQLVGAAMREIAAIERTIGELRSRRDAIATEEQAARLELARAYLVTLDAQSLAEAERRTGFRGFSRMDPLRAMAHERHRLEVELAQLRADERYARREYLVGPNGEITRQIAEIESFLAPWQAECAKFESHEGFLDLLEAKYDTPEFDRRWWQPSYWKLWAAGDRITEALGMADFGDDVLPAYEKVRVPRDQLAAQRAAAVAKRDEVHQIVQRHDFVVHRLQNLAAIYLDECQQALAGHLAGADHPLLDEWSGEDRGVRVGLRRVAGLRAKLQFHDEMVQGLEAQKQTLQQRLDGYRRKALKFQRPKNQRWWNDDVLYPKGMVSIEKARAKREKLLATSERVQRYDRYDRFDVSRNPPETWWVEMTDAVPGPLVPGLAAWYATHRDVQLHRDGDDHDVSVAVAAAAADTAMDALGDVS